MDQGSDFISDFRARRIRTQITWENLSAENSGILGHKASAPITSQERCHVTQPRAGINVSCSPAGHKGATGGSGGHKKRTAKGLRRGCEGWVPHQGTRQSGRGRERVKSQITVSRSRAGQKGAPRTTTKATSERTTREDGEGWGPDQGGTGLDRDSIALKSQIKSRSWCRIKNFRSRVWFVQHGYSPCTIFL
jgi:hypothetical protein